MSKKCLCILIVSLNPGERLRLTLDSIFKQTADNLKIIIKDGGSKDGSLSSLKGEGYFEGHDVTVIESGDTGIYDGMNQAVDAMKNICGDPVGNYCMFLNCGDTFYDEYVLEKVMPYLKEYDTPHIIYGDQYNIVQKSMISSSPQINDFALYRNVPCHQVCFYDARLFEERGYNPEYTVRADYEHFLYCYYKRKAVCEHIDVIICNYEGGGYSETAENRRKSALQHKEITNEYMGKKAGKYRAVMLLTLAPLRTKIAESPALSGMYNKVKSAIYKRK